MNSLSVRFKMARFNRNPMQEALRKQYTLLASLLQLRIIPGTDLCVIGQDEIRTAMADIQKSLLEVRG